MKLGIGSYTLTWAVGVPGYDNGAITPHTSFDLIDRAAAEGLSVVQICDNMPLTDRSDGELAAIAGAARAVGVTLEIGTRHATAANLLRHLEIAGALDAKLVRTLLVNDAGELTVEESLQALRAVLPAYGRAGVRLAIENHESLPVAALLQVLERADSPALGICLDTVNSFGALEDPARVIAALAPHTINLHVKDFVIERLDHRMGFQIRGCPAGSGRLDVPGLLATLRGFGHDPSVILEQWTPYQGTVAATVALERRWADESVAYLKGLGLL